MTAAVRAQGAEAKKAKLSALDCPYGPGENRDAWMSGFGAPKEEVEVVTPNRVAAANETTTTVRKGAAAKKGQETTKVVTRPAPGAETALETVTVTDAENGDGVGGEAVIGDPSKSTTAAEADGDGINLDDMSDKK